MFYLTCYVQRKTNRLLVLFTKRKNVEKWYLHTLFYRKLIYTNTFKIHMFAHVCDKIPAVVYCMWWNCYKNETNKSFKTCMALHLHDISSNIDLRKGDLVPLLHTYIHYKTNSKFSLWLKSRLLKTDLTIKNDCRPHSYFCSLFLRATVLLKAHFIAHSLV